MAKQKYSDPHGRHIRVYTSLLNSHAYRVIGFAARALFFDLRATLTGTNNGDLTASLADLIHRGWSSSATLSKALYELRATGLIAVTIAGGLRQGRREPSRYRFTDLDVFAQPKTGVQALKATHDYVQFSTVAEALTALRVGVAALQKEGRRKQSIKKSPVQNLNPSSSINELETDFSGSDSEQGEAVPIQILNKVK